MHYTVRAWRICCNLPLRCIGFIGLLPGSVNDGHQTFTSRPPGVTTVQIKLQLLEIGHTMSGQINLAFPKSPGYSQPSTR